MSSILEALKKLEEEKQRQLKLLEKEEEEEQELSESFSISTIAKPDTPIPVHDTASRFLTPKFLLVGLALLIVILSIISVSVSFLVVKTQVAKNVQNTVVTEMPAPDAKTEEPAITPVDKPTEEPREKAISDSEGSESITPPPANSSNTTNNIKIENIVSPSPPTTPDSHQSTPTKKETPIANSPTEQKQTTVEDHALQIAKNTPLETSTPIPEEAKKETSPLPLEETTPQPPIKSSTTTTASSNVISQVESTNNTTSSSETSTEERAQQIPTITTRELEPPSSLKPEQFQQTLSSPKMEIETSVDMTKLPVLKTSDRVRLGLDSMQLNVLREAGPKNPHGLAIINLTKVYVGEMIPGSSVRLIDVKTHGIAIEVVGSGERYYVPR